MHRHRRFYRGMTLVEVLLATTLLAVALVPVFSMMPQALAMTRQIEVRTRATFLAQQEMERILVEAPGNFSRDFSAAAKDLGNGYLASITDAPYGASAKQITVQVGQDTSGDGALAGGEALVTLVTVVGDTTEAAQ